MINGIVFDEDRTLGDSEEGRYSLIALVFQWMTEDGDLDDDMVGHLKDLSGFEVDGFDDECMIQYLPVSRIISRWALASADRGYDRRTYSNYFTRLFELAMLQKNDRL